MKRSTNNYSSIDTNSGQERFEPNAFYERLIKMRELGKLDITDLSIPTRYMLAQYEANKRQAEALKEGER